MKWPKFLQRNKSDEEDDDEDFEDFESEAVPNDASEAPSDDAPSDDAPSDDSDDDIEFDDDDEDDDDDDGKGAQLPLVFIIVGAVVLLGGIAGGAAFWLMGSQDEPAVAAVPKSNAKRVNIPLPPRTKMEGHSLNAVKAENENIQRSGAPVVKQTHKALVVKRAKSRPSALASLGAGGLNARAGKAAGPRQGLIIPATTGVSYRSIPDQTKVIPLASAPDKMLEREVSGLSGPLPIIGKDGRKPWEVYSRPLSVTGSNPRIAIIVTGLGLSRAASMAAIKKLPGNVSLAFSPYARDLNDWLVRARLAGHEVFLELPMESKKFPAEDAGPLGLNSNLQVAANIDRLNQVLSKMGGYVGVISTMGSKFSEAEGQLKPVMQEIKKRGLMFVDGTGARTAAPKIAAEIQLPKAFVNVSLDDPPDRLNMDRKLKSLEGIIRKQSTAVASIQAYPSSIERLIIWARTIEDRKMTLVPLSAMADKQFIE